MKFEEQSIHRFFVFTLILKGIFAVFEIIGGIGTFFLSKRLLLEYIQPIAQSELAENPNDLIANHLLNWAEHFSVSSQLFAAVYLLSHGAIKLWLINGLLRYRLWYYPAALLIFGLFIIYQLYRFNYTHSVMLVFITILDVIVIILTWHEYRYLFEHYKKD